MNQLELTQFIKKQAADFGFKAVGIARAEKLNEETARLQEWMKGRFHGTMSYLEKYGEIRNDPRQLLDGARSVVSLAFNYYNPEFPSSQPGIKISRYAAGRDYHKVLKGKLKRLVKNIEDNIGPFGSRICVDSAPIMEKVWATRAGLGWIGKNGNLIIPGKGSFYFLAELIVDFELDYDKPAVDHCGNCRICLDACPTKAIVKPYVVDARRCISYLTIEHKGEIDAELRETYDDWVFGCDICQDVCPFNRFAVMHDEKDFIPKDEIGSLGDAEWQEMTAERYEKLFFGSAVKRTGFEGLKRNIKFISR